MDLTRRRQGDRRGGRRRANSGTCDCDLPEWTRLNLQFQLGCPGTGACDSDALDAAYAAIGDTQRDWMLPYLLGDGSNLGPDHAAFAGHKAAVLTVRGQVAGRDYETRANLKHYAVEDLSSTVDPPRCHVDLDDPTLSYCEQWP